MDDSLIKNIFLTVWRRKNGKEESKEEESNKEKGDKEEKEMSI